MADRLRMAGRVVLTAILMFLLAPRPCAAGMAAPVRLGLTAGFSGPTRAMAVEIYRGATACLERCNRAGGLKGRPVELLAADDGYQPTAAIENTVRFLTDDHVTALLSQLGTPTVSRTLPVLRAYADQGARLFFPVTGLAASRQPPYADLVYNLRASYGQEIEALVGWFVSRGLTRIAICHQADAFGRSGWDGARRALARRGLRLAGETTFKRLADATEDMTPQAALLRQAAPQAVLLVGAAPACAAALRDMRRLGLDVPAGTVSFAGGEILLAELAAAGAGAGIDLERNLVLSQVTPDWRDDALPAAREYRQALAELGQRLPPPGGWDGRLPEGSASGFEGFLNARTMLAVLAAMPDPGDRSGLDAAAAAMAGADLGVGLPVNLDRPDHQALDTVYLATARNGRLVPLETVAVPAGR